MEIEEKLLEMKKEIENAKSEASKLEGQLETNLNSLKDKGCETIEDAQGKLKEMETKITSMTEELESGVKTLEEKHDWNL